ncbi:MAG TPA: isoprenyl transferase [Thermoclostridium caenicola]|uniref:Isoprenyl transferase n=1 Tax=Thermoclostridium caenicola TaxID=659425 RepID=A0A1M6GHI1_9FIRM|nr:isoprenyl transferase [Thermoclostridium caenicola]SHJ09414.1 undecaprenyl diphosphate synthase [Thermoclostridium caenicola]HOK43696.1 isoprenyl transferase [Thermoclostridium caenicola]HOL83890.1 isoprenyl transferase [Thermoclostridium caenicola]HOP73083.1 isoprenyl transferase [Thermoclostridium caenicola]HPO75625.1 isoprenyl transferase [Thermoclostridium caenicola]
MRTGKTSKTALNPEGMPRHIAIIMDGNGRWAKKRGLSRSIGHREGSRVLKKIVEECYNLGIRYLTVFAFSCENWSRPKEEVDQLMKLMMEYLKNSENELRGKPVRIRVIGDRSGLPADMVSEIERVERNTAHLEGLDLIIAINYGGRQDILHACKKLAEDYKNGRIAESEITMGALADRLWTAGIPEPDLLIRTSGEIRFSNFLIWQSAYAELYFTDVLWPDFTKKHLHEAIVHYQGRQRRFGGL